MLFLYRPRQTWMPYRLPRNTTDQAAYNRRLQERFDAMGQGDPSLRAVLQRMPKGADLHSHLSGAVQTERLILWAIVQRGRPLSAAVRRRASRPTAPVSRRVEQCGRGSPVRGTARGV